MLYVTSISTWLRLIGTQNCIYVYYIVGHVVYNDICFNLISLAKKHIGVSTIDFFRVLKAIEEFATTLHFPKESYSNEKKQIALLMETSSGILTVMKIIDKRIINQLK
jgi:hypothetical protein